ncbi:MAG: asparagine synthase-related protein, partial [Solirubrobacterales bacterium]
LVTDPLALAATRIVVRGGSVLAGSLPYLCAWQLPPVSPNLFFWNPLLARAAEDGIEVMLGGEGGDELFSFSPALLGDRVRRGRLLSALKLNRRIHGAAGDPSWRSILRLMQAFGLKAVVPYRAHRAIRRLRGPDSYSPPWLRPETARAFFDTHDPAAWKRAPGPLWWRWLVNATVRGRAPRLAYDHVRRRAASFGIETRQPLVDVDVIELVLRLPPEHAFDPRHSRPLLRESVAGVLPDELRLRPVKSHFDSVFHEAFAGTDLSALRALLGSDRAEVGAYVDLPTLRRELLDPPPPPAAHGRQRWALNLWRLATAECWLRSQDDPLVPERLAGELGLAEADFELQTGRPPARERPATDRTGAAGA